MVYQRYNKQIIVFEYNFKEFCLKMISKAVLSFFEYGCYNIVGYRIKIYKIMNQYQLKSLSYVMLFSYKELYYLSYIFFELYTFEISKISILEDLG